MVELFSLFELSANPLRSPRLFVSVGAPTHFEKPKTQKPSSSKISLFKGLRVDFVKFSSFYGANDNEKLFGEIKFPKVIKQQS